MNVGSGTYSWNKEGCSFLWLFFHVEMLLLCPQKDKISGESIIQCVTRHMGLFPVWPYLRTVG